MALGLRHHIHEGENIVGLVDLVARDVAAQDLCEDVGVVVAVGCHGFLVLLSVVFAFAAPEGPVFGEHVGDRLHLTPFPLQIIGDGMTKARMGDVVGGMGVTGI